MNNLNRSRILLLALIFSVALQTTPSLALTTAPQIAQDKESGYDRSFFKHWIDENKNGCDTRAEVLISEAVVKPKRDKKCKLTGGKWLSAYDGKSITNASQLDVDHLVPLAEAWRSGAWAWTPKQRQDYANDLIDTRALIAVTLTTNRSKSDRDISDWVPKVDPCGYVQNWIAIKIRYSLTYDPKEAKSLSSFFEICKFGDIPVQSLSGYTYQSQTAQPLPSPTVSNSPSATPSAATPVQPVDVTDNECPKVLKISIDKQSLSANEKTLLKITYEDDKNSLDISASGYSNWVKPSNLGTLEGGNPVIGKFKIVKSEKINGRVLEEIEGVLTAPSGAGIWKFGFLSIHDKGGNWISFEGGNQLCSRRGYIPAPDYNLDLTISTPVLTPSPTATPTPTQEATIATVSPGAFCSPAGATGKSANGTSYTCKISPTDTRNRWRQ